MQAEQCQGRNLSECSQISNINLQQEILSTLSRLSFTSQQKAPFELQGTSIRVTHDGQLVSNKYVIFHIRDTGDVSGVSSNYIYWDLMFIVPCIVIYPYSTTNNIHLFLKLFILVKHCTCFGRSFRPSSGAQNCTYGNRHMSNSCCLLLAGEKWLRNRCILLVVL